MIKVYINDKQKKLRTNSLIVNDEVEQRSTASMVIRDLGNAEFFKKGMPVRVENNGNIIFRGFIETSEKIALTNTDEYVHRIECIDLHYLADKRIVALAETNTTAGSIVGTLIENYLEAEGVENTLKYWADYDTQTWNEVIS